LQLGGVGQVFERRTLGVLGKVQQGAGGGVGLGQGLGIPCSQAGGLQFWRPRPLSNCQAGRGVRLSVPPLPATSRGKVCNRASKAGDTSAP